ncbi:MAG: virulence factor [Deinococcales bacterium]
MAAKLTILFWRDIPSQVIAQAGRQRHAVMLSEIFQKRLTALQFMRAKQAGAYMDNWRKEVSECGDDLV